MSAKTYLTLFLVVLAMLVAFRLAGAIVHYFFWPLVLLILVGLVVLGYRGGRNG